MNAPDKFASLLALTREPFPASTKSYLAGSQPGLRVPVRDIQLTNGEVVQGPGERAGRMDCRARRHRGL